MKTLKEQAIDGFKGIFGSEFCSCPCCESDEGFALEPSPVYVAYATSVEKVKSQDYHSFPVLLGRCRNCGYLVQFDARYLAGQSGTLQK